MLVLKLLRILKEGVNMAEYDLEKIWEEHLKTEFETKNVDATMQTMIDEPYVNHIPTMTGGTGKKLLHHFYANYFIPKIPSDTNLELISRTVGKERLIDEFILTFTHDTQLDFMLPNIPPTGKFVELPHVVIVTFAGDKIANEHIYWDQASLLAQVGLLDINDLPIVGKEQAAKLRNKNLPSNSLIKDFN